jgi:hypothetical protein
MHAKDYSGANNTSNNITMNSSPQLQQSKYNDQWTSNDITITMAAITNGFSISLATSIGVQKLWRNFNPGQDCLGYHTSKNLTHCCTQRKLERQNNRSKQVAASNNDTVGVHGAIGLEGTLTGLEPTADAVLVEGMVELLPNLNRSPTQLS